MKVSIFGGSGFVGDYLIRELVNKGHDVYALVRYGNQDKIMEKNKIKIITGDIDNPTAMEQTMMNTEAIIYNIGIIRENRSKGITFEKLHYEGLKKCVDMAKKLNIKRFVLMSANGVCENGTGYQSTKFRAEEYLKGSGLDWTIFRPSLIFGDSNGKQEFCKQLRDDMLSLPFPAPLFFEGLNIFSAGKFKMSPIHVKDVSQIFIKSLSLKASYGNIYELGGKDLTWKSIVKIIANASDKMEKMFIPAPAFVVKGMATLFGGLLPISKGQITMLMEGNVCESDETFKLFEIETPIEFNEENLSYLNNAKK